MRYTLTVIVLLLISHNSSSQGSISNDSIYISKLVEKATAKTDTIAKLKDLRKALNVALDRNNEHGFYTATNEISLIKRSLGEPDSARFYHHSVFHLIKNPNRKINIATSLASIFRQDDNRDSAIYYLDKAKLLINDKTKKSQISNVYTATGNFWFYEQNYIKAFEFYSKSDSILSTDPKLKFSNSRAKALNFIGYSVRIASGYDKALEYYLKSRDIYEKIKNEQGYHEVNVAIAQAYISMEQYNEAIELLNQSVDYQKHSGDFQSYTYALIVRGYGYVKMKDFKKAEKDYLKYYEYAKKINSKILIGRSKDYLGYFYFESKDYKKSIKYYKEALEFYSNSKRYKKELDIIESLIEVNKKISDLNEVTKLYEIFIDKKKAYDANKVEEQTRELETKYQTDKREQEITLLKANNKIIAQQKINQRNIYLAGIGLTSAIGIFLFLGFRNRKKTNDKLKELDTVKSSFFANISHEFRTPLTLISGPLEEQLQKEQLSNKEKRNLKIAKKNSERLVKLVDQLLNLSKLESGNRKLMIDKGNLKRLFHSNLDAFTFLAESNDQQYTTEITLKDHSEYWYDTDIIERVITNLVDNAIKHSSQGECINVKATVKEERLFITVSNTGSSLSSHQIHKLFERFYSTSDNNVGTGIGLALTKELVLLHKGKIEVESTNNEVFFNVELPVSKKSFKNSEIHKRKEPIDSVKIDDGYEIENDNRIDTLQDVSENDLPVLLIVDDNSDLRKYLASLLEDYYKIVTSENGNSGFDKATEVVPDLIITDLMMENGDGLKLTKHCKTTEITSHIPIIMLTAKAGDENELIGLETGADAYITKPFNMAILKKTIQNLIDSRKKLQERYSQEVVLLPNDIKLNSTDMKFLDKLQSVMDTHLVEVEFDVSQFADLLGMSRMQLHRKLKALTGQSATEFIRNQRLNLAAQLLKKATEINISEIAYKVGFNNPSYFTRCFKKQYGVAPSDFKKP